MKNTFLISFFTVLHFLSFSQNLVPNPSFENYSQLPSLPSQWTYCDNWTNVGTTTSTPDYYHILGGGNVQLPNSLSATVFPKTGDAIMGFFGFFTATYREYVTVKLPTPLEKGGYYHVSYWITNGVPNLSGAGCNNLGFNLTTERMSQSVAFPFDIVPTYYDTSEIWTSSWQQINHSLRVDTNYNWLTLGNFHSSASTSRTIHDSTLLYYYGAYYFIDDVSITEVYPIDTLRICQGDSVQLPQPTDTVYQWVEDAASRTVIATDTSIVVHPTVTTTYMKTTAIDTSLFIVYVEKYPLLELGQDTSICEGTPFFLSADTGDDIDKYVWQDSSTFIDYSVDTTGQYYVEVTHKICTSRDTINVTVNPQPFVNFGADTNLCQGDSIILHATQLGQPATYLWQDSSTASVFTTFQTGTYDVEVDLFGCKASDEINVTVLDYPVFDLGNDTSLCEGEGIILSAFESNANSYLWQDNQQVPTYFTDQTGLYWVEATNGGICSTRDSILITVTPYPVFDLGNDTIICEGDSIVLNVFNLNAFYEWQDGSAESSYLVREDGEYKVEVRIGQCMAMDSVKFEFASLPRVDLGPDTYLCPDDSLFIGSERAWGNTFLWQDGSTNSFYIVREAGTYWVEVEGYYCQLFDTVSVELKECVPNIVIPNIITPNGDGYNDYFTIPENNLYDYSLTIYNRWGKQVYQDTDYNDNWRAEGLKDGAYFYKLVYEGEEFRGWVNVVR